MLLLDGETGNVSEAAHHSGAWPCAIAITAARMTSDPPMWETFAAGFWMPSTPGAFRRERA